MQGFVCRILNNKLVFTRGHFYVLPFMRKGQLISKAFWHPQFFQKTNEKIRLNYYDTSSRLVFEGFFGGNQRHKKPFRNYLTFRTIYSNSERSELFLVTEYFFNMFLEVSHI